MQTPPAPPKRKRGRETAADMIRSMGLILLIIIPVWYLAQPPDSDEQAIRVVDPGPEVVQYQQAVPGVPVPGGLPPEWRATSSTLEPGSLRIGYVTPIGEYAEYAASTAPADVFLPDITGGATEVGSVTVDGVAWRQLSDGDDHTSLVRSAAGATVVVGGVRETTTLDELRALAAAVR